MAFWEAAVASAVKAALAEPLADLKDELHATEARLKVDINDVEVRLKEDINRVETSLKEDINGVETRMKADIDRVDLRLQRHEDKCEERQGDVRELRGSINAVLAIANRPWQANTIDQPPNETMG